MNNVRASRSRSAVKNSYYFVEYARAKRALVIALVLLGLFLLAAIILRISVHDSHWQATLQNSPTAHVTSTTLADGSTRTVVDDPAKQTHAVIVKRKNGVVDMDVIEPRGSKRHHADFVMGMTNVNQNVQGNKLHTTIHYVPEVPKFDLGTCFLITMVIGLITASILGGVLAKENDGHLELAWTKPVSREGYALSSIAVDALALIASQLLAMAVLLLAMLMFFVPKFTYGPNFVWAILLAFAVPIAWYALVTAASASLKRGPGVVIGLGWVAAVVIPGVAAALQGVAALNPIAAWFYAIFRGLSYIDPISYLSIHRDQTTIMPFPASVGVMCALIVGYIALAVAQWRRVEA
jgi:hypothetical protein